MSEADNQPLDGVCFDSHGNYGSRVFDSMDGHIILISVCDACLIKAGEKQQVLSTRTSVPVLAPDVRFGQCQVGYMKVDRPCVFWRNDLPPYNEDDVYLLSFDDGETLPKSVHLNIPYEQQKLDYEVQWMLKELDEGRPIDAEDRALVRKYLDIPGKWNRAYFVDQFPEECQAWADAQNRKQD